MKICNKCEISKDIEEFYSCSKSKDGKVSQCKGCAKEYYQKNKKRICKKSKKYYYTNLDKCKQYNKKYRKNNLEKFREFSKKYYRQNTKKVLKERKKYRKNNKQKIKEYTRIYMKERYAKDPVFKINRVLRSLIYRAIKGKSKNQQAIEILGCSIEQFWKYLESKFTKGMTKKNHGKWHIDHIMPLSSAKNKQEKIKLSHYTNFQPLWAKDNLKKSNKI